MTSLNSRFYTVRHVSAYASTKSDRAKVDMNPLFKAIIDYIPAPTEEVDDLTIFSNHS